jgi:hypothetical protein
MNSESLPAPAALCAAPAAPAARISDRLTQAIEEASTPGRLAADGRAVRHDGWTPERITLFLTRLADCGVVSDAARAAGMSKRSAYAFRRRPEGRGFDMAWDAALQLGRKRLSDELMSRALNGCVEIIVRDGEVWGERHRFDNRHAMAMLTKLEEKRHARDFETVEARRVSGNFDAFVEIVSAGGEGIDDFLLARAEADRSTDPDAPPNCIEVRFVNPGEV